MQLLVLMLFQSTYKLCGEALCTNADVLAEWTWSLRGVKGFSNPFLAIFGLSHRL